MWEFNHKVSWALKNWCFWTVVEDSWESPLDCKEIKPVNCKGNQSWIFIERTNAKAAVLWPPDAKNWLLWKDPDARKDWRWEEKGTTEDEVIGWHHRLNGHDFEQALGAGDGQGSMACYNCNSMGLQRVGCAWATELNWAKRNWSCVWLSATPWTVAHQAPLSTGILQARILEWVLCPNPGIKPRCPTLQADFLPSESSGYWTAIKWISWINECIYSRSM